MIKLKCLFSCRGIRASCSFSFLEVVVGCDIADYESSHEDTIDDTNCCRNKTIYLHLKKFFRGTRFTFQPFLKSIQEKHKEGEIVCVSGKVSLLGFSVRVISFSIDLFIYNCICLFIIGEDYANKRSL